MSVVGGKADIKGSKADMKSPMSVIPMIMSVNGGKADEISGKADISVDMSAFEPFSSALPPTTDIPDRPANVRY